MSAMAVEETFTWLPLKEAIVIPSGGEIKLDLSSETVSEGPINSLRYLIF